MLCKVEGGVKKYFLATIAPHLAMGRFFLRLGGKIGVLF